jgi:hypothetical protein
MTGLRYEYDGNPHSFGSYHPQYVDYSKKEKENSTPGPLNFGPSSSSSLILSQLSSYGGKEVEDLSTLALPPSDYSSKQRKKKGKESKIPEIKISQSWIGSRLPNPFVFNKIDIFSAMDVILRDTSIMTFES